MKAIVWCKTSCPFCVDAKNFLSERGISYEERVIGEKYSKQDLLEILPNARTVPQIFIDNVYVGGYNDLIEYFNSK